MVKTIVKETIITILLCLAILVLLSVILYAYTPNNKVIPEKISYKEPEAVSEIIKGSEAEDEESQIILTYEINSSDLNNAQRIKDYTPGKVNPFSAYQEPQPDENATPNGEAIGGSASSSKANSNSSSHQNSDSSEGTYFKNKGTK